MPSLKSDRDNSPQSATSHMSPSSGQQRPHPEEEALHRRHIRRHSSSEGNNANHVRLEAPSALRRPLAPSVYMGSYSRSPHPSRTSLGGPTKSRPNSAQTSPRASLSHSHLADLLQDHDLELDTYGVEEFREGFFDATFLKPSKTDREDLMAAAEYTLPKALRKMHPLSLKHFFPKQWHDVKCVSRKVATTRAGIKLLKSFLAFFIAYILCLIPEIRGWLGRYSYIMCLSAIISHPGRTIGAEIDSAFLTIAGSATGLGWGAFALWLSDSTQVARRGYGGILAAFLVLFMGTIAALRSYYIRFYQLVLSAGVAVIYTVLADTSQEVNWKKLLSYGLPWLFGQSIALLVCCIIFPDAGARPLAVSLHDAFSVMQDGLILPQPDNIALHRQLALTFVNLSQAYRDLVLDISLTRFRPSDVKLLRNLMQAVIRSLLALRMETHLLEDFERDGEERTISSPEQCTPSLGPDALQKRSSTQAPRTSGSDTIINIDGPKRRPRRNTVEGASTLVVAKLADPTMELLSCMRTSLASCDAVLMDMSGYRKYLGPKQSISSDVIGALMKIRKAMIEYDSEEEGLMEHPAVHPTYSDHPEIVELFLFVHPIRQAAASVEALLVKVMEMQQRHPGWRVYLPSYPFAKSLQRTNAQVRHDRGGLTAGFYFRSQEQLARTMKGMANIYQPWPRQRDAHHVPDPKMEVSRTDTMGKYEEEKEAALNRNSNVSREKRLRYRLWSILHRLQGFETRFALKVAITTSLLSVPAWLSQSRGWWNDNESWWAVVVLWIMSHPRVGGNFQDLVTRALFGALGAVWGGISFGIDNGNPYVMAVFAAIYMIPMIYRYTQSSHPRSGIVGCISFVVISLSAKTADGLPSVVQISWTRGLAFVIGVVAAVVVNWILWPFVARHELRKALSAMLVYLSVIYRGVVAKYVYYEAGEEPGPQDIERSGS
jgi:hypothetical protein